MQRQIGVAVGEQGQRGAGLLEQRPEHHIEYDQHDRADHHLEFLTGALDEGPDQNAGHAQDEGAEQDLAHDRQRHDVTPGAGRRLGPHVIHEIVEEEENDRDRCDRAGIDDEITVGRCARRAIAIAIEPAAIELDQRPGREHAHRGKAEARPWPNHVVENRTEELGDERAEVDAHVEDGEAGIPSPVALLVERADDGGDIGFEEAVADRDHRQRREHQHREEEGPLALRLELALGDMLHFAAVRGKQGHRLVVIAADQQILAADDGELLARRAAALVDHLDALTANLGIWRCRRATEAEREIAERHQDRAELHRALGAQIAVGEQAADQRRQIDERGKPAIEAGRRAVVEQEIIGEIEREQRPHAVIAEPLPHLGGKQALQLPRMLKPTAGRGGVDVTDVRLARTIRGRCIDHAFAP